MALTQEQRDTSIDLTGDRRRRRRESVVKAVFFSAAAVSILISVAIVLALIGQAWSFLTSI
jgi:ABC-type phosphate transport system permease subunit